MGSYVHIPCQKTHLLQCAREELMWLWEMKHSLLRFVLCFMEFTLHWLCRKYMPSPVLWISVSNENSWVSAVACLVCCKCIRDQLRFQVLDVIKFTVGPCKACLYDAFHVKMWLLHSSMFVIKCDSDQDVKIYQWLLLSLCEMLRTLVYN